MNSRIFPKELAVKKFIWGCLVPGLSCWAACLDLQSPGKRMQQPGESWAGVTLIAGGGLSRHGRAAESCPCWAQQSSSLCWEQLRDDEKEVSGAGMSCPMTPLVLPLPEHDLSLMTFSCSPGSVFVLGNTFPLCLPLPHCLPPG